MALPEAFDFRIKQQLNDEYDDYISCLDNDMYHGIRVNTAKISVEKFLEISPFELTPVPWTDSGFYYDEKKYTPSKHPYYYAGLYYIQEPSAMTPASVLDISEGDVVLDICAAPGGKSTELAAKLQGTGFLVSNDISSSRAKALLKNLELFGIGNMCVTSEAPNKLSSKLYNSFDKILVDAPCSGEGMFRKSQSMINAWEKNGVEMFVNLQHGILNETVKMLKPGGSMVYSTCTFSPEEDEQAVEYLLSLDESLELIPISEYDGFCPGNPNWGNTGNPDLKKCVRLWPHHLKGEGHFVALLHKKEQELVNTSNRYMIKPAKIDDNAAEFLNRIDKTAGIAFDKIEENNGRLTFIPEETPDVAGLRLLRKGLFLGEIKKNRFEPSEALAMYLKKGQFDNEVDFSSNDERVIKYLKGETIEITETTKNGYILVLVDGFTLGWAKNNNGTLKNKYLAGWRMI